MTNYKIILIISAMLLISFSCSKKSCDKSAKEKKCCSIEKNAIAIVQATAGNKVSGVVYFQQKEKKVNVTANIEGLTPNQKHGFHIHQYGDISALNGTSAGGHYNPKGVAHSLPHSTGEKHLGDLGNLSANAEGKANLVLSLNDISLCCSKNSIIGRSIIIHKNEDDGGQPTGNAGPRIGMGVIGISK